MSAQHPAVPFGSPQHPFKYESHVMRARGKKGKSKSPWGKFVDNTKKDKSK